MRKKTTAIGHAVIDNIEAPHYRTWQGLYLSFFSSAFYVDVAKRWRGWGVVYLLMLVLIMSVPFAIRMTQEFRCFFTEKLMFPIKNLPPIEIKGGEVVFDKPMPYLIKNKKNEVMAVIDTTGQTEFDKNFPTMEILITKTQLKYRFPPPQLFLTKLEASPITWPIKSQSFDEQMNQTFDAHAWLESSGLERLKPLFSAIIFPTVFLMFFVMYAMFLLVVGLMAQFIAQLLLKCPLTYQQTLRLLVVAATPCSLILFLVFSFNSLFWGLNSLSFILLIIYFVYGALSVRRDRRQLAILR